MGQSLMTVPLQPMYLHGLIADQLSLLELFRLPPKSIVLLGAKHRAGDGLSNMRLWHHQEQLPVGQGGMFSGTLHYVTDHSVNIDLHNWCERSFRWLYDCGSNQAWSLSREISAFQDVPLDVLFLSHLDGDHVRGVDALLLATVPREVVLPYLNDDDWAFVLARELSAGRATRALVDMARDPAGWFGERGVRRVTFVEADDEEGDAGPADRPPPDGPELEARDLFEKARGEKERSGRSASGEPGLRWSRPLQALPAEKTEARLAPRRSVASIVDDRTLPWILAPYAHRPSAKKRTAFRAALSREFAPNLAAKDYAAQALQPAGRAKLRLCYDKIWKGHNLVSMTLYSGPLAAGMDDPICNTAFHGKMVRRNARAGWLGFGDFDASVKVRRARVLAYYRPYLEAVGQLTLPHHGSDLSCDATLLHSFSNLRCAVASVGANIHGHPGDSIQAAVHAANLGWARVDENPASGYSVRGYLR